MKIKLLETYELPLQQGELWPTTLQLTERDNGKHGISFYMECAVTGNHEIWNSDVARVRAHWAGYCENALKRALKNKA